MIRPLFNILLGIGYLLGFMLVWFSLELLAYDRLKAAPSLAGLVLGIGWWSFLTWLGRRFTPRGTNSGGGPRS